MTIVLEDVLIFKAVRQKKFSPTCLQIFSFKRLRLLMYLASLEYVESR